jgi:hypothetical protein
MKPVDRSEILELGKYEEIRDHFRRRIIEGKRVRRIALGEHMTVLFENHDTALFQIQEMLRTERITQEAAILHELETYNELVPGERELSATVFVEYADRDERDRMLVELAGVEGRFYVDAGGERAWAHELMRGDRRDRTTAVHYLKFPLNDTALASIRGKRLPVKLGVDHAAYRAESELSGETLAALAADFE